MKRGEFEPGKVYPETFLEGWKPERQGQAKGFSF